MAPPQDPGRDCRLCPRLVGFREQNRSRFPAWHNAPVPAFGDAGIALLIVGLAPGLRGANRTGRPFTGDFAGDLLYRTLLSTGFAEGDYGVDGNDDLRLVDCRITNAVRCVPPENKPTAAEVATCGRFLTDELTRLPNLRAVLALGLVAHNAVLASMSVRKSAFPFAHGRLHRLPGGLVLADSYHCSRLNTNTGRLTAAMFEAVFADLRAILDGAGG